MPSRNFFTNNSGSPDSIFIATLGGIIEIFPQIISNIEAFVPNFNFVIDVRGGIILEAVPSIFYTMHRRTHQYTDYVAREEEPTRPTPLCIPTYNDNGFELAINTDTEISGITPFNALDFTPY